VMSLLMFLVIAAGFWIGQTRIAQADPPPIPELPRWESQMTEYGAKHCALLQDTSRSGEDRFNATYYDAERVYYQMADYTRDSRWLACAQAAEQVYRDGYVFANNGRVPGYVLFPHGLWMDLVRNKDGQSKQALSLLATEAAFAADASPGSFADPVFSREVAYNLQAKLLAQEVGAGNFDAGIRRLADEAFRHMDAWFISKSAPYVRPFMVGLTSEALILLHTKTGDPRVLPAIQMAMNWLWDHCWLPNDEAFMYTDRPHETGGQEAAPDVNLIVAPAFGWLYKMTGNPVYAQRGDQIFAGGAKKAFLNNGKQFNQSYRFSFSYVAWRLGRPDPITGTAGAEGRENFSKKDSAPSTGASGNLVPRGNFGSKRAR
jgi:hypothetical protein